MKLKKFRRGDQQIEDLADQLLAQNAGVLDAAKESLKKKLLEAAMRKAIAELGDPETIAERLLQDLGEDNEAVLNASEALKTRLLNDIARRSLEPLTDPSTAADAALRFIDLTDDRIEEAGKAVRERLLERVVSGAIDTMIDEEVSGPADESPADVEDESAKDAGDVATISEVPPPDEEAAASPAGFDPADHPPLSDEYHNFRDPWAGQAETSESAHPGNDLATHDDAPSGDGSASSDDHTAATDEGGPRWVNRISYEDDQIKQFRQTVTARDVPCYYTYGVMAASAPDHILPNFGIESNNPPYALACGPVRAIVSRLTSPPFRRSDREQRFEEPQMKRELKNAHVRVLEAIAATGYVVVPRPSGKFARSEDEIRRAIVTRSAAFDEALRKLAGRHEWSVHLIRTGRGNGGSTLEGLSAEDMAQLQASLPETELEGGWNGDRAPEARGVIGLLRMSAYNSLKAVSEEAVLNDTEHTEDARGLIVMSAAFLVDEQQEAAFRTALDSLRERYSMFGITIDCKGPRMPLSFCQ